MFKSEYTKQFDEFTPSTALNEETLALMQEAQAHPLPQAKKTTLRWVLPVCVSGAAAMVALTVGLAIWFNKPEVFDDIQGYDEFFIQDATPSGGSADSDDAAVDSNAPVDDAMKEDEQSKGESDSSKNEGDKGTATPEQSEDDEEKGEEQPAPDQEQDENTASTPSEEQVDLGAPMEITDKKTETYLSLRAFVDALGAKKTIGYKTNYLMEESLAIVPSWLPTTARFRQVYAYSNGGYAYSYRLEEQETEYLLNVTVSATQPKTQRDLLLRLEGLKNEEKLIKKENHQWTFYFGTYDKAIVTVTTLDGKAVSMEQAAELLTTLDFARYTVQNTLVELSYK